VWRWFPCVEKLDFRNSACWWCAFSVKFICSQPVKQIRRSQFSVGRIRAVQWSADRREHGPWGEHKVLEHFFSLSTDTPFMDLDVFSHLSLTRQAASTCIRRKGAAVNIRKTKGKHALLSLHSKAEYTQEYWKTQTIARRRSTTGNLPYRGIVWKARKKTSKLVNLHCNTYWLSACSG